MSEFNFSSMMRPIYRLHKRGKFFYLGQRKKPISENSFIYPYVTILTNKSKQFHKSTIGNISASPGIYGIFTRDKRNKNGIGKCLYVGQSVNMRNRAKQHKKCLATASNHVKGVRAHNKSKVVILTRFKTEIKYYLIIQDYKIKDLKFVSLYRFSDKEFNKLTEYEQKILLTMFEQCMIDVYNPKYNTLAARPNL